MKKATVNYILVNPDIPTILPSYATVDSSGADVHACIPRHDSIINPGHIVIGKNEIVLISTNIAVEIPVGLEIQIRPRSGLSSKHGVTVINTPGTIDSDYRGEIKIALINLGGSKYTVIDGDAIAQLVLCPVYRIGFNRVEYLSKSDRGEGGFGSTGIKGK